MLRRDALEDYRTAMLVWAPRSPYLKRPDNRPPSQPRILDILEIQSKG